MHSVKTASTAELGSPTPDAPAAARLGWAERLAYGLGATGTSMAWNLVTGFMVFYYSDVAGLPLTLVGTLMLVTRILDAIFDPVAGVIIDRTHTRWGKARPYLFVVPTAFAITLALAFAVPDGSIVSKMIYACVTFTLLGLLYSFFYMPLGAMLPAMARSEPDKLALAGARSVGIAVGSILIYAVALPLVKLFGGADREIGFTWVAGLAGLICAGGCMVIALVCREHFTKARAPRTSGSRTASARFDWTRNPIWQIEMAFSFAMFVRLGITVSDTAYYAKAVMGNIDIVSYMLPLSAAAPLLAGLAAPSFLKRFGIRTGNVLILVLSTICYLLLPMLSASRAGFMTLFFLANLSIGINTASLFVIFADACDLQEHRDGFRREGLLGSTGSFSAKVGMAVGGAILAFALSFAGYSPNNPTGSAYMVNLMFWLAPAIICAGQALLISRYKTAAEFGATVVATI